MLVYVFEGSKQFMNDCVMRLRVAGGQGDTCVSVTLQKANMVTTPSVDTVLPAKLHTNLNPYPSELSCIFLIA